jgi:hypothetical protein
VVKALDFFVGETEKPRNQLSFLREPISPVILSGALGREGPMQLAGRT